MSERVSELSSSSAESKSTFYECANDLLISLNVLFKSVGIYDLANQTIGQLIARVCNHIHDLGQILRAEISLVLSGELCLVNKNVIKVNANTYEMTLALRDNLGRLGIGGFLFNEKINEKNLNAFLVVFLDELEKKSTEDQKIFQLQFEAITPIPRKMSKELLWGRSYDPKETAVNIFALLLIYLEELCDQLKQNTSKNAKGVRRLIIQIVDHCPGHENLWLSLLFLDNYRGKQADTMVKNVILSIILAKETGFDRQVQLEIGSASIYRDLYLFRMTVDRKKDQSSVESLLTKRGYIFDTIGYLLDFYTLNDEWATRAIVAFEHFQRYDGSVLKGIPGYKFRWLPHVYSQILAITSEFVALVSDLETPMLPDEALRFLHQHSGVYYSPALLKLMINKIGIYPMGSMVELTNGEKGVVYDIPPGVANFNKPIIRITIDADGQKVEGERYRDLSVEAQGPNGVKIIGSIDPLDHETNVTSLFLSI